MPEFRLPARHRAGERAARPTAGRRRTASFAVAASAALAVATVPLVVDTSARAATPLPHGLGAVVPSRSVSAAAGLSAFAAATANAGGQVTAAAALPASVDLTS